MDNIVSPNRVDLPTSKRLLHSTLIAGGTAAAILCGFVLPTQYGLDPIGFGDLTGIVQIGERKMSLASVAKRSDEMTVTLKPGDAVEVKLRMKKGAKATYSWSVDGGTVNLNSRGEGRRDAFKRYKMAQGIDGDEGVLQAVFYGHHGWFWSNPNRKSVTVKLRTSGNYTAFELID